MTAAVIPGSKKSWLEYEHPEYTARKAQWEFAWDHYTGDVLLPEKLTAYLPRKGQGESKEAYAERLSLADFGLLFGTAVDTLLGMLFGVEDEANRVWFTEDNAGLGDPADAKTMAGRLMRDANGQGVGWISTWKDCGRYLTVTHDCWVFVDAADGDARVRILSPMSVPNWWDKGGLLDSVLIKEEADVRASIEAEPACETRYLKVDTLGFQRYTLDEKTHQETALTGEGNVGTHTYIDRTGHPVPPIFRAQLPLARYVGWLLAKRENAMFNRESERDNLLRVANFPKFNVFATGDDYDKVVMALKDGANVLENPKDGHGHDYAAPPSEPAAIATEVIKDKRESFTIAAFKAYGDSARAQQATATEIKQDVAGGSGAFLELLRGKLDDTENQAMYLVAQAEFSEDPKRWEAPSIERSKDFAPADVNAVIDRVQARIFGGKQIPVGRTAMIKAAAQVAEWEGIDVDEPEISAAVDVLLTQQNQSLFRDFPLGTDMKVELTLRLIESLGLVDLEEEVLQADGTTTKPRRDVIRAQLQQAALDEEAAKRRQAELFAGTGSGFGGGV
jgi:hypothetical protein